MLENSLERMLAAFTRHDPVQSNVIPWSAPIPAFGNLQTARTATLGINPSNREFVDELGNELDGPTRRFPTLSSLRLSNWSEANSTHHAMIAESCRSYFQTNPYDLWFRKLERLLECTGSSFYGTRPTACHLDLIPYATARKWTGLSTAEKRVLFGLAGDSLGILLERSRIEVLVLNGRSVVEGFQQLFGINLRQRRIPNWTLPRRSSTGAPGISYKGTVTRLGKHSLKRELLVLGYNHNIQSSFGVTTAVVGAIGRWLARNTDRPKA